MSSVDFAQPQRQDTIGIVLIFSRFLYRIVRAFWALLLVLIVSSPNRFQILFYLSIGVPVLFFLGLWYSYLYYQRFLFHIDFDKAEFVLNKGVFSSETVRIPFERMQQVDLKRSILQRLVGVYSVAIETAGSKGKAISILALSFERAHELTNILMEGKESKQRLKEEAEQIDEGSDLSGMVSDASRNNPDVVWSYRASVGTLLKVGVTKSYWRGFFVILGFFLTLYNQLEDIFRSFADRLAEQSESLFYDLQNDFYLSLTLLGFLLLISVMVTLGEIFIKYFGLRLERHGEKMEVEMGLKTNTKVVIQPRRLQQMVIITNPIQKWMNLYEAQLSLASSEEETEKSKIKMPALTKEVLSQAMVYLYPQTEQSSEMAPQEQIYRPAKRWIRRGIYLGLLLLLMAWGFFFINYEPSFLWPMLIFSLIWGCLVVWRQLLLYQKMKIQLDDRFLKIYRGFWTQKLEIIELYKMQGFTAKQPFYYRFAGLYNVRFHLASGDTTVRTLPTEFLKVLNFILYRVECSKKAWM